MELVKQIGWSHASPKIFHFRQDEREVDIILEYASGDVVGIEVKMAKMVRGDDLKGLQAMQDIAGKRFRKGIILYMGQQTLPFGPLLTALPLTALWS